MADENGNEERDGETKKIQLPSLLLIIAWAIILLGTVVIGYVIEGLFGSGHLRDEWDNLTAAQGSILGQLITVYAAAFAAVVTPAIFNSKFASLEGRLKATTREIESLSQQTRSAFHTLNDTALSQAGVKRTYTTADLPRAREILRVMQAKAAEYAQTAKDRSRKWRKKEDFKGKWPNRQNYIDLLRTHNMITEQQHGQFMTILRSRRYTHGDDPQNINLIELNQIAQAFSFLQNGFDEDRGQHA